MAWMSESGLVKNVLILVDSGGGFIFDSLSNYACKDTVVGLTINQLVVKQEILSHKWLYIIAECYLIVDLVTKYDIKNSCGIV